MNAKSQIAAHLKIEVSAVTRCEEWAKVWFVVIQGKGGRFVSKKVIKMNLVDVANALEKEGFKLAWKTEGEAGEKSFTVNKGKQMFQVAEWANGKIQVHHQSTYRGRHGSIKKDTVSRVFVSTPEEVFETVINAVPVIKANEKEAISGLLITPEEGFQV